jgi:hypothetical protein
LESLANARWQLGKDLGDDLKSRASLVDAQAKASEVGTKVANLMRTKKARPRFGTHMHERRRKGRKKMTGSRRSRCWTAGTFASMALGQVRRKRFGREEVDEGREGEKMRDFACDKVQLSWRSRGERLDSMEVPRRKMREHDEGPKRKRRSRVESGS